MNHLSMARLYCKVLDFERAEKVAEEGLAEAEKNGDWQTWCLLASLCLRIYMDTLQAPRANDLKKRLHSLKSEGVKELASSIDYQLGMRSAQEKNYVEAERLFQSAAESANSPEEKGRALFGLAALPWIQDQPEAALQKLNALESELQGAESLATQFSIAWLKIEINERLGRSDARDVAMARAWAIARDDNNPYFVVRNLLSEAAIFFKRKELALVKRNLETVEKLLPNRQPTTFLTQLEDLKKKLSAIEQSPSIELFQEGVKTLLRVGDREPVDVTKLDLLMKLLSLLGEKSGHSVDKEAICAELWKEEYHPLRHDNKIYVTIRRLRHLLLDNDKDRPELILMKDGNYSLNPAFRLIRFHSSPVADVPAKKYVPAGKPFPNSFGKEGNL